MKTLQRKIKMPMYTNDIELQAYESRQNKNLIEGCQTISNMHKDQKQIKSKIIGDEFYNSIPMILS